MYTACQAAVKEKIHAESPNGLKHDSRTSWRSVHVVQRTLFLCGWGWKDGRIDSQVNEHKVPGPGLPESPSHKNGGPKWPPTSSAQPHAAPARALRHLVFPCYPAYQVHLSVC